jgi:hypothetical protein
MHVLYSMSCQFILCLIASTVVASLVFGGAFKLLVLSFSFLCSVIVIVQGVEVFGATAPPCGTTVSVGRLVLCPVS